jgi:hypothetical protein
MAFLYNRNENSIKNENSISFMPKSVKGISYGYGNGYSV